jgi:hypothetical protein
VLLRQAHLARKRGAVRRLPRLWALRSRLGIAALAGGSASANKLIHLGSAAAAGTPAPFTQPRPGTLIDLDHPYLPPAPPDFSSPTGAPSDRTQAPN